MISTTQPAFQRGAIWEFAPAGSQDLCILDGLLSRDRARLIGCRAKFELEIATLERLAEYRGDLQLVTVMDGTRVPKLVITPVDPRYVYEPARLVDHDLLLDADGLPLVATRREDELGRPLAGTLHGEARICAPSCPYPQLYRWCAGCGEFFALSFWPGHAEADRLQKVEAAERAERAWETKVRIGEAFND